MVHERFRPLARLPPPDRVEYRVADSAAVRVLLPGVDNDTLTAERRRTRSKAAANIKLAADRHGDATRIMNQAPP
jgi:hypothetical protein